MPVRCFAFWPFSMVTTRSVTAHVAWPITSAVAAAAQPTRLTGLWVPNISRKTVAANAVASAVEATLNAIFNNACRRRTVNVKATAQTVLRTSRSGERKTSPKSSGTSSSTKA